MNITEGMALKVRFPQCVSNHTVDGSIRNDGDLAKHFRREWHKKVYINTKLGLHGGYRSSTNTFIEKYKFIPCSIFGERLFLIPVLQTSRKCCAG